MEFSRVAQQFGFFVAAGVLTTALDFTIYNLLTRHPVLWPRIRANCVSVSAAICFSFGVNLFFVFKPDSADLFQRAARFLMVTAFSAYVLQNFVIYLTSRVWELPARSALLAVRQLPGTGSWSDEFIRRNAVKIFAVLTGLVWNFFWYRYYVFDG